MVCEPDSRLSIYLLYTVSILINTTRTLNTTRRGQYKSMLWKCMVCEPDSKLSISPLYPVSICINTTRTLNTTRRGQYKSRLWKGMVCEPDSRLSILERDNLYLHYKHTHHDTPGPI